MKRKARAVVAMLLVALVVSAVHVPSASAVEVPAQLPRTETLYFGGQQWGAIASFNPFHPTNNNWAYTVHNNLGLLRTMVWESLFAYNMLDGKIYPLLGTEYSWSGQDLTVKINPDAHWSDGKPVIADDVAFTFALAKKYTTVITANWEYLEDVVAVDKSTVVFKAKRDNFAPLMVETLISGICIVPKHVWEKVDADCAGDSGKFLQFGAKDMTLVSSGPYRFAVADETKVVHVRDDNYWGQAPSLFGKLPAPKYIAHNIFKDNNAVMAAFRAAQIDVNQQFMPQIWKLWEDNNLPISTYIDKPPYYIPGVIPTLWFNLAKPGLDDVNVRKAIALAINYKMIAQNAMSGYTPDIFPSMMLPVPSMLRLVDLDAIKPYQWTGNQIDEANKLLDDAGWLKGPSGFREKNGVKLSFKLECPSGWTDWNASLEIVAQAGRRIGMEMITNFRDQPVFLADFQAGQVDIAMWSVGASSIAAPWLTARNLVSTAGLPPRGTATTFNYGRYMNARANELVSLIATETNEAKLKELWTELTIIYLKDVPSFGLMYRPVQFYEVNETVWTGFPKQDDGTNIPPTMLTDGWGIKGLYVISPK